MNGDKLRFSWERIKEILKTEFLIPEDMLEQKGIEQAAAALEVYGSVDEFLESTGWGRDNPEYSSEEYLTDNQICRWVDGNLLYFSRLAWEKQESSYRGDNTYMKWGAKIMLGMLVLSFFFFTVVLGRNLWVQEREKNQFEALRDKVVATREVYPVQHGKLEIDTNLERTGDEMGEILPEYKDMARENPDFAGWISIKGTKIDYPVMQTPWEPEYYLHRNFFGENSYAGVPFVGFGDMREGDIFLYGHNMRNGTMFADLLNYQKQQYLKEHPAIYLDTLWEKREYQVFAVFYATECDWNQEDGLFYDYERKSVVNRNEYLQILEQTGLCQNSVIADVNEKLLFLVTCSYEKDGERFVVVGKSIENSR